MAAFNFLTNFLLTVRTEFTLCSMAFPMGEPPASYIHVSVCLLVCLFACLDLQTEEGGWTLMKPVVFGEIMDFFAEGKPVMLDEPMVTDTTILDDDDEVVAMIKELLQERVGFLAYILEDFVPQKMYRLSVLRLLLRRTPR